MILIELTDKEKDTIELRKLIKEYLDNGGKIKKIPLGAKSGDIEYLMKFNQRGRKTSK